METQGETVVIEESQDQRVITFNGKMHGNLKTKITATAAPEKFLGDGTVACAAEVKLYATGIERWTVQFFSSAKPGSLPLHLAQGVINEAPDKDAMKGEKEEEDADAGRKLKDIPDDKYEKKETRHFEGYTELGIKLNVYLGPAEPGQFPKVFNRHRLWITLLEGATAEQVAVSSRPTGQTPISKFMKSPESPTPEKTPPPPVVEDAVQPSNPESEQTSVILNPEEGKPEPEPVPVEVDPFKETDAKPYENFTIKELRKAVSTRKTGTNAKDLGREELVKILRELDRVEYEKDETIAGADEEKAIEDLQ